MSPADAAKVMLEVQKLWPAAKLIPEGCTALDVATSWGVVLDVGLDAALDAVIRICHTGERFAPNPGQIRQAAAQARTAEIPDVDTVWAEIETRIARVGWFAAEQASVEGRDLLNWSHPITAQVVMAMGGFKTLCLSEAGSPVVRAQMRQAYTAAAERLRRQVNARPGNAAVIPIGRNLDRELGEGA